MMKKKTASILLFLLILLIIGTFFSYKHYHAYKEREKLRILIERRKASWTVLQQVLADKVTNFKGETGIVIKDLEMDWKISFGQNKLFPSASLAKIPIMVACYNAAQQKRIKLEDTLKLKSSDKVSGSGVLKDMAINTSFTVEELIEFMIKDSDNTATNMLIDLLGFDYLNESFKSFGLKDTNLVRKMMDFRYRKQGTENYTTAEDMAYILDKIYLRQFINSDTSEKCLVLLKQQNINDRIPAKLPIDIVIAHKTGLERNVCHDAGIVFTRKGNFLICVLTEDAGSSKLAKEFISGIALDIYNFYQQF